jgi:hypothetical protein
MRDPCDVRQTASAVDVNSLRQLMTATVKGPVLVDTPAYLLREPSGKPNVIQKARPPGLQEVTRLPAPLLLGSWKS